MRINPKIFPTQGLQYRPAGGHPAAAQNRAKYPAQYAIPGEKLRNSARARGVSTLSPEFKSIDSWRF
jgi:hypothetical protein